jgi:hypothetical protein
MEKCEVGINFKVPRDKAKHIFDARDSLAKAVDTGGCGDKETISLDWEFDWSLKGPMSVGFKRMKGD